MRALVWSLGRGMVEGIGRIMTVLTVEVGSTGTCMGEEDSSLSLDSWMMILGLLVSFWRVCVWICEEVGGFLFLSMGSGWSDGSGLFVGGCEEACV